VDDLRLDIGPKHPDPREVLGSDLLYFGGRLGGRSLRSGLGGRSLRSGLGGCSLRSSLGGCSLRSGLGGSILRLRHPSKEEEDQRKRKRTNDEATGSGNLRCDHGKRLLNSAKL
jgi:hypothetical protein